MCAPTDPHCPPCRSEVGISQASQDMTQDVALGIKQGLWEFHVERTLDPLGICMSDEHRAKDRCSVSTGTTFQAIPLPRLACIWTAPSSVVRCLPMMGSAASYVIPEHMPVEETSATPAQVESADDFAATAVAEDKNSALGQKAKLEMAADQLVELAKKPGP